MTTRILAGLAFEVQSPSLYVCDFGNGILALEYQGAHRWAARVIRLDEPETCAYYSSLSEIELVLSARRETA